MANLFHCSGWKRLFVEFCNWKTVMRISTRIWITLHFGHSHTANGFLLREFGKFWRWKGKLRICLFRRFLWRRIHEEEQFALHWHYRREVDAKDGRLLWPNNSKPIDLSNWKWSFDWSEWNIRLFYYFLIFSFTLEQIWLYDFWWILLSVWRI